MNEKQITFQVEARKVIERIVDKFGVTFLLRVNAADTLVEVVTLQKDKCYYAVTDYIKPENAFYWLEAYEIALMVFHGILED